MEHDYDPPSLFESGSEADPWVVGESKCVLDASDYELLVSTGQYEPDKVRDYERLKRWRRELSSDDDVASHDPDCEHAPVGVATPEQSDSAQSSGDELDAYQRRVIAEAAAALAPPDSPAGKGRGKGGGGRTRGDHLSLAQRRRMNAQQAVVTRSSTVVDLTKSNYEKRVSALVTARAAKAEKQQVRIAATSEGTGTTGPDMLATWAQQALLNWQPRELQLLRTFFDASARPNSKNAPEHTKLVKKIVRTCMSPNTVDSSMPTWSNLAKDFGCSHGRYVKQRYDEVSELVLLAYRVSWSALMQRLVAQHKAEEIELVSLSYFYAADSTPLKLRVNDSGEIMGWKMKNDAQKTSAPVTSPDQSTTATVKILQQELRLAVLIRRRDSDEFQLICGELPAELRVLDHGTAETLCQTYYDTIRIPGFLEAEKHFKRIHFITTGDMDGANLRQENAHANIEEKTYGLRAGRLQFPCRVHRFATVNGKTYDLAKYFISGTTSLALGQRGGGQVKALRKIVGDLLVQRLRIMRGSFPPGEGTEEFIYRSALLDLLLPATSNPGINESGTAERIQVKQRCVLDYWLQGDWTSEQVRVYVSNNGPSDAVICQELRDTVAWALVPHGNDAFPMHRWTGAKKSNDYTTLLMCCHKVGVTAIPKWAGIEEKVARRKELQALPDVAQAQPLALTDGRDSCTDKDAQGPVNAIVPAAAASSGAIVAADPEAQAATGFNWPKHMQKLRATAGEFASEDHGGDLKVLSYILAGTGHSISSSLRIAGPEFDRQRALHMRAGVVAWSRWLLACRGHTEGTHMKEQTRLLFDGDAWLALTGDEQTIRLRSFAWQMLTKQVAGCEQL